VLIGGNSDAAARRVAALGDGWLGAGLSPEQTLDFLAGLRALGAEPGVLELSMRIRVEPEGGTDALGGADAGALADRLAAYRATGIDLLVIDVMNLPDPVAAVEGIARIA